jgi:hypothetical protein
MAAQRGRFTSTSKRADIAKKAPAKQRAFDTFPTVYGGQVVFAGE